MLLSFFSQIYALISPLCKRSCFWSTFTDYLHMVQVSMCGNYANSSSNRNMVETQLMVPRGVHQKGCDEWLSASDKAPQCRLSSPKETLQSKPSKKNSEKFETRHSRVTMAPGVIRGMCSSAICVGQETCWNFGETDHEKSDNSRNQIQLLRFELLPGEQMAARFLAHSAYYICTHPFPRPPFLHIKHTTRETILVKPRFYEKIQ